MPCQCVAQRLGFRDPIVLVPPCNWRALSSAESDNLHGWNLQFKSHPVHFVSRPTEATHGAKVMYGLHE